MTSPPREEDCLIPKGRGGGLDEEDGSKDEPHFQDLLHIDGLPSSFSSPPAMSGDRARTASLPPVTRILVSLLRPLPSIFLMVFLNLMMAVPFGSTVLSPVVPLSDALRQQLGMRMGLLALAVGQFSLGSLPCGLSSSIESVTLWQMGELSPFYHTLAEIASIESNGDVDGTISTTLFLLSLSTLSVAVTFYVLGKTGLASVTYFFPSYVMLGLVGGVGVWCMTLSATISVSPRKVEGDHWWDAIPTYPFLLSVAISMGLMVIRRVIPKDQFPLLDPFYFLSVPVVFYVGLWALGLGIDEAVDAGYMFKDPGIGKDVERPLEINPWEQWVLFDPSKVHWTAIVPAAPTLIASSILCVILVAPFIPPLAAFKGMDDFDMDHEFKAQGYANMISGILSPGGLSICICYSTSSVYSRAGGKGKLPSAVLSAVLFCTFVYGPLIVDWLPRCLAGSLILDMGINLFLEGILDPEGKCDYMEYLSIWIIIVTMTLLDMTAGLVAGLVMALVTHALQSYMGQKPVRIARDARALRSSRWRDPAALSILTDPERGSKNIGIFMLQGYLFFGNISVIQKRVFEYMQRRKDDQDGVSMVILDLTLVVGIDSSAMVFINKMRTQLQKKFEVSTVVFVNATNLQASTPSTKHSICHNMSLPSDLISKEHDSLRIGLPQKRNDRVSLAGSFYKPHPSVTIDGRFFDSLDQALSSCEDALISQYKPGLEKERTDMLFWSLSLVEREGNDEREQHEVIGMLKRYCREENEELLCEIFNVLTRECFGTGHVLWHLGEKTTSAKLLLQGSVFAFVDEHDPTTFRETIKCGVFMGLRGLILGEEHLATVRCETKTVMYSLDEQGYRRLLSKSPNAARALDLSVARYLSHRLQHVSNRVYESKSLPL